MAGERGVRGGLGGFSLQVEVLEDVPPSSDKRTSRSILSCAQSHDISRSFLHLETKSFLRK